MPLLAQSLISSFGWRTACVAFGAMTLAVSLPITAFVLRDSPQDMNLHPDGGGEARPAAHAAEFSIGQAFRSRIFWSLAGGFFLLSLGANGVLAHLPALASDRGIAARDAALTTSVLGGASLLGRLVTGVLLDRFFGPHIAVVVLLGAIGGMAVLATSYSLAGVLIAAALMGLAIGAEADLMPYLISRYMGLRSMGEIYGYIFTAYAVAGALGPLVMGWGYDTLGNYTRIVWVFAGATGMSAILLGLLPRYPQHPTTA
jgi:MFS family permease